MSEIVRSSYSMRILPSLNAFQKLLPDENSENLETLRILSNWKFKNIDRRSSEFVHKKQNVPIDNRSKRPQIELSASSGNFHASKKKGNKKQMRICRLEEAFPCLDCIHSGLMHAI